LEDRCGEAKGARVAKTVDLPLPLGPRRAVRGARGFSSRSQSARQFLILIDSILGTDRLGLFWSVMGGNHKVGLLIIGAGTT